MEAQPCRTDGSISPRLFNQKGFLIFRDYCKRAIRATQKTILGSFGIDEADAKVRALAIGKEVMYAEEPEKEEDEYGTFWFE